jgi:hypothetical protein
MTDIEWLRDIAASSWRDRKWNIETSARFHRIADKLEATEVMSAEIDRLRTELAAIKFLKCTRCGRIAPANDWGSGEYLGFNGMRCPDCWPDGYSVIPEPVKAEPPRSETRCHYCDGTATKTLVWLKDKRQQPTKIMLPWCGCDLQVALQRFWPSPYTVVMGVDYEIEPLEAEPPRPAAIVRTAEGEVCAFERFEDAKEFYGTLPMGDPLDVNHCRLMFGFRDWIWHPQKEGARGTADDATGG